jgi:hypothetical protein
MKTPEERLQTLERLALELNAAMPTDVALKGDGTIWIVDPGNGTYLRKVTQQAVLELLYTALNFSNRMVSV